MELIPAAMSTDLFGIVFSEQYLSPFTESLSFSKKFQASHEASTISSIVIQVVTASLFLRSVRPNIWTLEIVKLPSKADKTLFREDRGRLD